MKKYIIIAALVFAFALTANVAFAAFAQDYIVPVQLDVNSSISLACSDSVTMKAITGTGKSQWAGSENDAYCLVKTNNSTGYKLEWQASYAEMATGVNNTGDQISAFSVATPGTTEAWAVNNNASEWGAKLRLTGSTDTTTGLPTGNWGSDDTYTSGKWLDVATTAQQIVNRATETPQLGSEEYLRFGAEVGSAKFQPTGTYKVNVTMTATTI